jgi:methenyltetrahydrofolate cyclohydrolase
MYTNEPIRKYLDDASSGSPTPGGGSISALAGALATSMGCMAANFTLGKKKFAAVEPQVRGLLARLDSARDDLLRLMDDDIHAYGPLSEAYKLPRDTDAQKLARDQAIQDKLKTAMDVPLRVMRLCRDVLQALAELAPIANPNLISDVGVAAVLAEASARAARLNVDINLRSLKDTQLAAATRDEIEAVNDQSEQTLKSVMNYVSEALGRTP